MVEILCHSCPKTKLRNTRIIPKILTKFKHVFLTMFASKSDSARISVENFISKYHPNFAAEYRKKCGPHSTRFQCRRHYVADIFCQKMSPKMSPTFKKCRRHLHRHFRRNYQNIGWVHRCRPGRQPATKRSGCHDKAHASQYDSNLPCSHTINSTNTATPTNHASECMTPLT